MRLQLSIQTFYKWSNSNYVIQDDCDAIFAAAAGYQTILPSMMCATDPGQSASFVLVLRLFWIQPTVCADHSNP